MFAEDASGPLAETHGAPRTDLVADGYHRIQVVVLEPLPDLPLAVLTNYREILGGCRLVQLGLGVDVLEVQADIVRGGIKKLGHLTLRRPKGLALQANLHRPGTLLKNDDASHTTFLS